MKTIFACFLLTGTALSYGQNVLTLPAFRQVPWAFATARGEGVYRNFEVPIQLPETPEPGTSENLLRVKINKDDDKENDRAVQPNEERHDFRLIANGPAGLIRLVYTFTFRAGTPLKLRKR